MNQSQLENVHYQHAEFDENASPEEMLAPPPLDSECPGRTQLWLKNRT